MLPSCPNALDRSGTMQQVQLACRFIVCARNLVRGDTSMAGCAHHVNELHLPPLLHSTTVVGTRVITSCVLRIALQP